MTDKQELEIRRRISDAETYKELAECIIQIGVWDNDKIQGRNKVFSASKMANACLKFEDIHPNHLTRNYGIRQQAMYIRFYTKPKNRYG